jgi:magnesium-transporting ATPase (P-type)
LGADVREFLYALSLNNSIFPKTKKEAAAEEKKDDLKASLRIMDSSSPDETALCNFAQFAGYEVFSRVGSRVTLRVDVPEPHFEEFEQVCCIDFNSKRKAMTVIVRRIEDGKAVGPLKVYTKGADTSVYALLAGGALKARYEEKSDYKADPIWTDEKVKSLFGRWSAMLARAVTYNEASLRSLMIARSEMDPEWWYGPQAGSDKSLREEFESLMRDQGPGEIGHVEGGCGPTCRLCVVERKVELGASLDLIGCTAIEDKLQDGVPDALKALMAAGINVWVLTGDNIATAINIGVSCDLLDADMEQEGRLFRYDKLVVGNTAAKQAALRELINKNKATIAQKLKDKPKSVFGACVHGDVWKQLSRDPDLLTEFFQMTSLCRSVIACRLEPKEKATIVESVRSRTKVTCLAIGDGNNDTPMIKAADIGVGIKGVEGTSAVAASDYALGQFRFLTRLLLVYGHYNYRGIAYLTKYIFYKCSMVVWTQLFFGVYSGFSGQFLFLDWAFQFHNVAYTALPIFALSIFDKDLSPELLESTPELYQKTRGKAFFSMQLYWGWMLMGFGHAAISFYIPWYAYEVSPSGFSNGASNSVWLSGLAVYTVLVIIANVRLCLIFTHWTWLHFAFFGFSAFTYWLAMFVFDASSVWELAGCDYYATFRLLMSQPLFWVVALITCLTAFSLDLVVEAYNRVFRPNVWHVHMEKERFLKRTMPKQVSSSRIDDPV